MNLRRTVYLNLGILAAIFLMITGGYFFGLNFLKSQSLVYLAEAQSNDTIPPKLSEIKIADIGTSSMAITWKTDEPSDALVNYSLDKNYGISRDPLFTNTSHKILVDGLKPGTTYYFRVISSDPYGNQAISGDYNLTTKSDEQNTSPSQSQPQPNQDQTQQTQQQQDQASQKITNDVIDMLQNITNPEDLLKVQDSLNNVAGGELNPPAVLGAAPEVELGSDYAIIKWVTDRNTDSIVAVASERDYKPNSDNPYVWTTGQADEQVLDHQVRVVNLSPATTYHYQIVSRPELGPEGRSKDFTFKTKSVLPEIYNLRAAKVEEDAATITFNTNVPTKAIVSYTNLTKKETKLAGSSNPVTAHSIRLTDLVFDTTYSVVITAENEVGDKVESYPITFTTVKDVQPPAISKVNTESTLYPGSEGKIQTIISWETDELAECQFFYQEGILSSKDSNVQPKESDYTTKHVQVVTSFTQATVYKYWIKCTDHAGNEAVSESFTILTPAQEQSILDLIIGNFESTFGWLKKK